jgi:hypothetical protein
LKFAGIILFLLCLPLLPGANVPETGREPVSTASAGAGIDRFCSDLYNSFELDYSKPGYVVLRKALTGFFNLESENRIRKNLLTIIDFSLSSNLERMWIIDLGRKEVVHSCLCAHGRNSGGEYASSFSNTPSSYKSSLGFYITGETYTGKHGLSLLLDGAEPGINDKARERAIVMHGADYVSRDFITRNGRLGRSFGCPSIPMDNHEEIINLLSGQSCLYIHFPDNGYLQSSPLLVDDTAMEGLSRFMYESLNGGLFSKF